MGIAEKVNPGFAYFDKPWLLALFVAPLTLAGGVGLLLFFQTSCTSVCALEERDAYTLTRINEAITLWRDITKPPCNERDCSFASFEADFCIYSGRNFILRDTACASSACGVAQEISEGICQIASDKVMFKAGYGPQQYKHPKSGGSVDVSGFHWCDGSWERENGFYTTRSPTPPWCGRSIDGTTVTDPVTGVYLSGNSLTFNLHYHYRRETCKAICPSFFEAFSDANANLKYVELIMTAIIALILIPAGIVKARPGNDKDATIGSVIRSTDGMMVSPSLAPVPASSTYATAHASHELVLRACCGTCGRRSIFSSSRIKFASSSAMPEWTRRRRRPRRKRRTTRRPRPCRRPTRRRQLRRWSSPSERAPMKRSRVHS
jgi:hypothetical protein